MLVLKRCSDVFEGRRDEIIAEQLKRGRTLEQPQPRADSKAHYEDNFF